MLSSLASLLCVPAFQQVCSEQKVFKAKVKYIMQNYIMAGQENQ